MSDTATMTLTEFLLARLAEDEAVARAAVDPNYGTDDAGRWVFVEVPYEGEWPRNPAALDSGEMESDSDWCAHATRHDPARVLAEVASKRAIIGEHPLEDYYGKPSCWLCAHEYSWGKEPGPEQQPCATLRHLAAPYADHEDYRAEWAV